MQREVVAHAVRYSCACVRDGHARDRRGEHEFFVKVFGDRDVKKEYVLEFTPELEAVFGTHAVECVGIDIQDAFDHVGERVDRGVDNQRFLGRGEVLAVDKCECRENAVWNTLF